MATRPLNYTTTIAAAKTVGECQHLLASAGASAVAVMYENKEPIGVSFRLDTPHGRRDFTMPVNVGGVLKVLNGADIRRGYQNREQAVRVAWRVVKDWLEAQLAIINAQMATLDQIMLPYLHVDESRTLYEAYREGEQLALSAGEAADG